jgi:RNA polymerase sigma factor (sigma-70 family)
VPPHWNHSDWFEEIDAESIAAACHAIRIFDPNRGPTLGSFVYHQILASALGRYRQEWTYAIRYDLSTGEDASVAPTEDRFAIEEREEQFQRTLTKLPEADRRLIVHLFWEGRTETEVASGLGISQHAVLKRKAKIFKEIRQSLAGAAIASAGFSLAPVENRAITVASKEVGSALSTPTGRVSKPDSALLTVRGAVSYFHGESARCLVELDGRAVPVDLPADTIRSHGLQENMKFEWLTGGSTGGAPLIKPLLHPTLSELEREELDHLYEEDLRDPALDVWNQIYDDGD